MCAGHDHDRFSDASFGGLLRNLRAGDHSLPERFRLVGQAYWRRLRGLKNCCGYYGEPGC